MSKHVSYICDICGAEIIGQTAQMACAESARIQLWTPGEYRFDEIKGIEWRTRPMPTGKHYCYETKNGGGVGKVIGQFFVWRIQRFTQVDRIPSTIISAGCVSTDYLKKYGKGKPLYAHWIDEAIRYEKPIALSEFRKPIECHRGKERQNCVGCWDCEITRPPQSWCYVEGCTE